MVIAAAPTSERARAIDADCRATLTVRIVDFRNHRGNAVFGVFRSPTGFPEVKVRSVEWQVKPVDADTVVFTMKLPPGQYAASVLHDENRNNEMDRNLFGVPLEGYGVTNNPKPKTRAATFNEAMFTLPPQGTTMTISLQYF